MSNYWKIFNQPVSTRDGCTYEKQAIKSWMNTNKYSPTGIWISKKYTINESIVKYISRTKSRKTG